MLMVIGEKADVIPVSKVAIPADITENLRPIFLTATLSKICENFITDSLIEWIREKFDKLQFGSLKNS